MACPAVEERSRDDVVHPLWQAAAPRKEEAQMSEYDEFIREEGERDRAERNRERELDQAWEYRDEKDPLETSTPAGEEEKSDDE